MPILARHHKSDIIRGCVSYWPVRAWPEDCTVQWGSSGLVFSADGSSYGTAFFEAFPTGKGFFRGEGQTINQAEQDCFDKWLRYSQCDHHWQRGRYNNGGAICRRCKAFATVFHAVHEFGEHNKPIRNFELNMVLSGDMRNYQHRNLKDRKMLRKIELRLKRVGIELPTSPDRASHKSAEIIDAEEEAYMRACRRAVIPWYLAYVETMAARAPSGSTLDGFFMKMSDRSLDWSVKKYHEENRLDSQPELNQA